MNVHSPLERATYLDNLRWMAMLLGVFVHGSTLGDFGLIDHVTLVSEVFRMALFFMISGYLGAMLLTRKGEREFLTGRMRNLAIPFFAALILLNPATLALMFQYVDGQTSFARVVSVMQGHESGLSINANWHLHLWFLISLMCFVLLATVLGSALRRFAQWAEAALLQTSLRRRLIPLSFILGGLMLTLTLVTALRGLTSVTGSEPWLVRVTLQYAPFYLTGMVLYYAPSLFEQLRQPDYLLGAVILLCFIALRGGYIDLPGAGILSFVVLVALRFWVCFFLLGVGFRFLNRSGMITRALSASIYTVYLFHFLILYIVALTAAQFLDVSALFYCIVVGISIALSLALHFGVISRSPILLLLLNGRVRAKPSLDARQTAGL